MKKQPSNTGRLKKLINQKAYECVYPIIEKEQLLKELSILATLNEAHSVALFKTKYIPGSSIKKILKLISNLRKSNFLPLLDKSETRGAYFLFENYLIKKLGMDIAGSLHIGRSRNDINATAFKLSLRNFYIAILKNLCDFRFTLLKKANQYTDLAMPIYSQFQVAQIGTYAYYLLALESALARDQHYLQDLMHSFDECPIGAAAGCGTSFSINYQLIAVLLGFTKTNKNALDAVADRDLALRLLSLSTILATHLSRIAQDYQLWTTQEFSFFELPDDLCGGSSMMPQKKNPYLFEVIKGRTASLNGMLTQSLTAMHNVPFSNSVEIGTESVQGINNIIKKLDDMLILTNLLIEKATPIAENMAKSINKGVAMATGITEEIVEKRKAPFRQTHYAIGSQIAKALSAKRDPVIELCKGEGLISERPKNIYWAYRNEFGGGPGKKSVQKMHQRSIKALEKDYANISHIEAKWNNAAEKLQQEILKIIQE